jgi:hypothetical protein
LIQRAESPTELHQTHPRELLLKIQLEVAIRVGDFFVGKARKKRAGAGRTSTSDVALQVAFERQTLKPVFSLDRL